MSGNEQATAPVAGTVTIDGEPLTSGLVTFWPEGGRTAKGYIQEDGTYTLGTYERADGATPGLHKISITFVSKEPPNRPNFDAPEPPRRQVAPSPIPRKYTNPNSSGLTFDVKAGEDNQVSLELITK